MSTAISFLDGISGYVRNSTANSADKPIRLAVVDPAYDAFDPPYPDALPPVKVTFEGETTLSGKSYPVATGFVPEASQRVWMVPIGTTYMIAGGAESSTVQGFYGDSFGSGVEFGDGSYFDTTSGLNLLTDADIAGDLTVGGIGAFLYKQQGGDGPSIANTTTTWGSPSTLFLDLPVGVWECHLNIAYTTVGGDIQTRWAFNGTWSGGKYIQGLSPFNTATTSPGTSLTQNDWAGRDSAPIRSSWHQLTTAIAYAGNDSANYAAAHEWGIVTVTGAGRWTMEYTQFRSAGAQAMVRGPSYMTARRVG